MAATVRGLRGSEKMEKKIVAVEGLIGVGKTTMLNGLALEYGKT